MNVNTGTVIDSTYVGDLPRALVYGLTAVQIRGKCSESLRTSADSMFERIRQTSSYRPHCEDRKRKLWHKLVDAGTRAVHAGGCVRYSRQNGKCNKLFRRLVECAVEAGYFREHRSPPGSPKQSRLLPTEEFRQYVPSDPWHATPPTKRQLVRVRSRTDKQPLSFDPAHPVAVETQRKLELVNAVNATYEITYQPADLCYRSRLRPLHDRLFHENWEHGRIYLVTARDRASLTRKERESIQFNGEPAVEWDYSAMHPRLGYHLRGLEYHEDPYALWGDATTAAQRKVAKLVVNTSLNAKSRNDAIGACFQAIRLKTKSGDLKEGNKRRKALDLRNALSEAIGLSPNSTEFFKQSRAYLSELYDLMIKRHEPIACYVGKDAGAEFMKVESSIALDVMHHLASKGIPVIGVHDSFVVPESSSDELRQAMHDCYQRRLGFAPVIK